MKGVGNVASELSRELTRLLAENKGGGLKGAERVRDKMYKVMEKYPEFGACDTEPSCVLVETIEKAMKLKPYELSR